MEKMTKVSDPSFKAVRSFKCSRGVYILIKHCISSDGNTTLILHKHVVKPGLAS